MNTINKLTFLENQLLTLQKIYGKIVIVEELQIFKHGIDSPHYLQHRKTLLITLLLFADHISVVNIVFDFTKQGDC